jgi:hypothetical protein
LKCPIRAKINQNAECPICTKISENVEKKLDKKFGPDFFSELGRAC